jgi:xylulokinase
METVLTFDIGGTSIRAGLFDRYAQVINQASRPSPPQWIKENAAEIPADDWWQAVCELTRVLFNEKESHTGDVKGICISGMTRSQIFLDRNGKPLRPAITWQDGRATAEAGRLKEVLQSLESGVTAGDSNPVNAYHPLVRLLWVKANEPEVYRLTQWVLQPKDYVNYKLTGIAAGDLISSHSIQKSDTLFDRLDLDPRMIPLSVSPETVIGTVRKDLPAPFDRLAGVPVVAGSMDGWCCTLGIGANRPGVAYDIAGTTEVVGIITRNATPVPGLIILPWGDDLFQVGGPTQAGGDCLTWFNEVFLNRQDGSVEEVPDMIKMLEEDIGAPSSMVFLPYLAGERTPIWDPEARGVFFGVNRRHTALDFLRAVMEGVAFAMRHILDLAAAGVSDTVKEVRIAGGGANLDIWCRIKSDITGRDIVRTSQKEAGLFGAALLALQGLGFYTDRQTLQAELVQEEKRFSPDTRHESRYAALYKIYRSLSADLRARFHELAAVRCGRRPHPAAGRDHDR